MDVIEGSCGRQTHTNPSTANPFGDRVDHIQKELGTVF